VSTVNSQLRVSRTGVSTRYIGISLNDAEQLWLVGAVAVGPEVWLCHAAAYGLSLLKIPYQTGSFS